MHKIRIIGLALFIVMLSACISSKQAATSVPFIQARNYFVGNTVGNGPLANPVIEDQNQFNSLFGMATTMGENGKPTAIDFNKQFVIALVGKLTDQPETFSVSSLKKNTDGLVLSYKLSIAEKTSYTSQALYLLVVDKVYLSKVKIIQVQ